MNEVADISRRLSLLSTHGPIKEEDVEKIKHEPPPPDKLLFVHLLFFLLGLMTIMPLSFFITANDYWMYKFRDPSSNSTDPNHRTVLQKNFAAAQLVANAVPSVVGNILFTRYSHKVPLRTRGLMGLSIVLTTFLVCTSFIEVNTDNWQVAFFSMTMLSLVIINATVALLQYTFIIITTKFPLEFMKTYMYGQGSGGVFCSSLQTICIAVGGGISQRVALIYFISGSVVIGIALTLFIFSNKQPLFNYYYSLKKEDTQRSPRTWAEFKPVLRKTWSIMAVIILLFVSIYTGHPTVTTLVVSEYRDGGDTWSNKYFVAVITFLFADVMSLVGRIAAVKPLITEKNGIYWVAASLIIVIIFMPLIWLCNAYPRHNLPVVFNHDWEYIIILGAYGVTVGYLFTITFLSVPTIGKGSEEVVFELLQLTIGVSSSILSPLGLIVVNLL